MNRKTVRNLSLVFGLIALVFMSCDKRTDEEKWLAEIRYFIMLQADDFESYQALDFQKIDLDFFMSDEEVQKSLVVLQDTTSIKLRYYSILENASDQLISNLSERVTDFPIDAVDEFQLQNARLDKALANHFKDLPKALLNANVRGQVALAKLNDKLGSYGLSIYNINLTDGDNIIYHHSFRLKGLDHTGIFELNKETFEVTSFKEI